MTTERKARRLDKVAAQSGRSPSRPAGPRRDSDEAFAAMNLVILAKELAGLAEPVFWAAEKEAEERAAEIARQMAESKAWREHREPQARLIADRGDTAPTTPKPRWSKTRRPGRNDWLTWDEIMQVPWIKGDDHLLKDDEDGS